MRIVFVLAVNNPHPMKPKYEIGQKVYFISRSGVIEDKIFGIFQDYVIVHNETEHYFMYCFEMETVVKYGVDNWTKESLVFPSKEELIKSL